MSRFAVVALLLVSGSWARGQAVDTPQRRGFLQTEFTPAASVKLGLGLLYSQATVAVPEWGAGRGGFARRAEWIAAGWMARVSTEYAIASYRGVDTGYRPCACTGFPRRVAHALRSGFLEYRADGAPVFAVARFSGLAVGGLSTIPMLPPGYGLRDAARRTVMAFGVEEGFRVVQEFRRDIVRVLPLHRHESGYSNPPHS